MNFRFEEREAFLRTSTHTLVRDCDPDFEFLRADKSGVVVRVLRIWLWRRSGGLPQAYLGYLCFCPESSPTTGEVCRVLRRLKEAVPLRGSPAKQLRQELLNYVRGYAQATRRSITRGEKPRQIPTE